MMSEHSVPIQITFTPEFKRQYKRLTKKYSSLDSDMQNLIKILQESPNTGKPLGKSVYKIRLAISSKKKGKSGGARVITYFISEDKELYLLSIYDKSEQASILDGIIRELINNVLSDKK